MVIELLSESQRGIFTRVRDQARLASVHESVAMKASIVRLGKEQQKRGGEQDGPSRSLTFKNDSKSFCHRTALQRHGLCFLGIFFDSGY